MRFEAFTLCNFSVMDIFEFVEKRPCISVIHNSLRSRECDHTWFLKSVFKNRKKSIKYNSSFRNMTNFVCKNWVPDHCCVLSRIFMLDMSRQDSPVVHCRSIFLINNSFLFLYFRRYNIVRLIPLTVLF